MSPQPGVAKVPSPPSITLSSVVIPLLTLLLGIVLAKHHSGHLYHLTTPVLSLLPQCAPTSICPFFYRRFRLPSGTLSTRLFDVPRRHLHSNYSALSAISPSTTLVHQLRHPRILVFDGGFDPLVDLLLTQTRANLVPTTVVNDENVQVVDRNRVSDSAFVSPHRDDQSLNQLTDRLVRLVGLPNRHYSEVIEVHRYNETGFFALHYDFLSPAAMLDNGTFHGCQRIATAVLQLNDVEGGETVFVRDEHYKGGFDALRRDSEDVLIVPTKKGRLIAWFNLHPDTEDVDKTTWHGSLPVKKGQKIAATFYLRNCSQADNSRRRAQYEEFMKDGPAPSTGVGEVNGGGIVEGDEDDDKDDEDEDDRDFLDPRDDLEYLKELRRYREIRDAGGNSTDALIKAGYSPDDFEDLDQEVLMMDEFDADEEDEKDSKEIKRIKLYKRIRDEGGKIVENLKRAGFEEKDFSRFDKEIDLYGKELDDERDEDETEGDAAEGGEDVHVSTHDTCYARAGGAADSDADEDDERIDEEEHLEAERELGMDEESIRAFREELREQGLDLDDDDEVNDEYINDEDIDDASDETVARDEVELGMGEESIRSFEQKLRKEQDDEHEDRETREGEDLDDPEDVDDVREEVARDMDEASIVGAFARVFEQKLREERVPEEDDRDDEECGGEAEEGGGDSFEDFVDDDFDLEFEDAEFEQDEDWDDDDDDGWDMMSDEMGDVKGKVIPPAT